MKEKPEADIVIFLPKDIPEEAMGKLQAAYQASERGASLACPSPETVIAYALEELAPEERARVQAHLSQCRACLDLVLDLRSARAETMEEAEEVIEPAAAAVGGARSPKYSVRSSFRPSDRPKKLSEKLRQMVSSLLSLPKMIPAAVAASVLLAIVGLGVYQHVTAPIAIHLDLIGRTTDGLLTRGPSEEKETKVPRDGVLRSGDRFQIAFETNKDAYVYVFFQDNA